VDIVTIRRRYRFKATTDTKVTQRSQGMRVLNRDGFECILKVNRYYFFEMWVSLKHDDVLLLQWTKACSASGHSFFVTVVVRCGHCDHPSSIQI